MDAPAFSRSALRFFAPLTMLCFQIGLEFIIVKFYTNLLVTKQQSVAIEARSYRLDKSGRYTCLQAGRRIGSLAAKL